MQLDGQVKEIHELVEELLNVEKEEREILSRIQDIELRTRRSGVIGHRVDEEFSSEIKQRDAKIQELENELLHNTNLLRQL
jgi:Arc/MetJ-type ribon-helix-helix transcriptional regulator